MRSDNTGMPLSFTRTLRLKVRREAYAWLNAAAVEVNQVFNYCNEASHNAATRTDLKRKFMSGFDLCKLAAGASQYFDRIGADTIQSICVHYAQKRQGAKRTKLRWRVSRGARRSLGWIPFKALSLKRKGVCLRFAGKCFRVFERERLEGVKWRCGCFAQDAVGDWWLCLPVKIEAEQTIAPDEEVGIDLGLNEIAATSDEDHLLAGAGRDVLPRSSPPPSAVATCAVPSAFIARPLAAGPMPCTSSRGRWSIGIRKLSSVT
jgi:putative transposase